MKDEKIVVPGELVTDPKFRSVLGAFKKNLQWAIDRRRPKQPDPKPVHEEKPEGGLGSTHPDAG